MIWLTNSDYNTLLTIASEMVLVPYFLVGAYLLKLVWGKGKANMTLVALGACAYGLWLLYASGPLHLLMSVILYAPGMLLFLFARRGGRALNALSVAERAAITLLVIGAVPATWMLMR